LLSWRITLSAVFIAALVGLCWLDAHAAQPGTYLLPLAIVVALAAAGELLGMFRERGHDPLPWVVHVGTLLVITLPAAPIFFPQSAAYHQIPSLGWLPVAIIASLLLAVVGEMSRFRESGRATTNLALAVFTIVYVGGLLGFLIQLRTIGWGTGPKGALGMLAVVSMIAAVKSSDIGQYTAGRLFGKHKLAPRISPGKTWEGVFGGLIFACFGAWITFHFWPTTMTHTIGEIAIYAVALAIAGIIGDLAESLLKRDAGVKDSSTWLPGFGGVLDLLDSLLGAAPIAYLFWAMHWIG
jgi:phosphatidate cytidylyltransferase